MRKLWLILVSLTLSVTPALAGKHKNLQKKADTPAASTSADANSTVNQAGAGNQASTGDVDSTLDELLAKPVAPKTKQSADPLQGHAEADSASSGAEADSLSGTAESSRLKALQPKSAPSQATVLKGTAVLNGGRASAQQDPDKEDQELMIEWDRWRNRFLRAVQLQVQAGLNHPDFDEDMRPRFDPVTGYLMPRFPLGTEAWFYCEVTADRRIKHLEITQSSGFPAYDRAVMEGVRALEGTSLLKYPSGSHRTLVSQEAGVRTSMTGDFRYHRFGDVERYTQQAP